jgi:hypothetical protein
MRNKKAGIITTILWAISITSLGLTHYQYFKEYTFISAIITAIGVYTQVDILPEKNNKE